MSKGPIPSGALSGSALYGWITGVLSVATATPAGGAVPNGGGGRKLYSPCNFSASTIKEEACKKISSGGN